MSYLKRILLVSSVLGIVAAVAVPAHAALVTLTQTGTWNTAPGSATQDAGLLTGGNYFITTTYDDALPTMSRDLGGIIVHEIELNANLDHPDNSFHISIPMPGFDIGGPFSYMQGAADHLNLFIPFPVIQFSSPSPTAANFVGYEFEGDFVSDATTNFVQLLTEVAIVAVGGVLVPTRSQIVQVSRCEDAFGAADFTCMNEFPIVIRSVNSIPAVPLPASLPLLAVGLAGLGALARRRRMRV